METARIQVFYVQSYVAVVISQRFVVWCGTLDLNLRLKAGNRVRSTFRAILISTSFESVTSIANARMLANATVSRRYFPCQAIIIRVI